MNAKLIIFIASLLIINSCGGGDSDTDDIEDTNNSSVISKEEANNTAPSTPITNNTSNNLLASNEPYYNYAWHIDSINSAEEDTNNLINNQADIDILKAWEITKGSGVKVAVIDDGYDINHEDLKDNIAVVYNVDDDSSDVSNKNSEITNALHGNTCAGFIVSPINGKGSVGIAPSAKLIGIKLLSEEESYVIKAFEYAQQQGAKVISCSWGTNDVSPAIVAKLKELYDAGITVVFASGNDGVSLDVDGTNDESEVEWVIGVGASSEQNDVTSYSNYGKNIEVIAPGGDTEKLGLLGIDDSGEKGSTNQKDVVSNNYAFTDGTSFATPITAGVIALMYSIHPNITPTQVKNILTTTATKVGGDNANYIDGFDEKRAYGKVNAFSAVSGAKDL